MTTNFTLSLSFDGIRLLQRAADGWHLVGEVTLDAADINAEIKALRKRAEALEPGDLRTKLLIPEDQIRYLSLDSTQTSLEDIHRALDGATPYRIDELVIDFDRAGGRTHIAAVARETLTEAEAFAIKHGFAPVCFVAVPPPFTFRHEVFFGPTQAAPGLLGRNATVARDDAPVVVTGKVAPQAPAAAPAPAPTATQPPAMAEAEAGPEVVFASRSRPPLEARRDAAPIAVAPRLNVTAEPIRATVLEGPAVEPLFTSRKVPPPGIDDDAPPAPARRAVPPPPPDDAADMLPAAAPTRTPPPRMAEVAQRRGKPRYLGLILTALLLLAMALAALWANTLSDDGIAGWFAPDDIAEPPVVTTQQGDGAQPMAPVPAGTAPIVTAATEAAPAQQGAALPAAAAQDAGAEVASAPAPAATPPLPILHETTGHVLSPAEAEAIYAATGVYQRAPRMPVFPRETTLDGMTPVRAQTAPDRVTAPALPAFARTQPDLALIAPLNPPAAGATFTHDARGFIAATPEGTLTPDGVVVFVPSDDQPRARPRPGTPEAAAAAPAVAEATPDDGTPNDDTPNDDTGTTAQPTVAETLRAPDGTDIVIVPGTPTKQPPLRPEAFAAFAQDRTAGEPETIGAAEPDLAPPTAGAVALAGFRPAPRPEALDAPEEAAEVALAADPALAGFQPQMRPEGLAPDLPVAAPDAVASAVQSASTTDINTVIAAITEAVPDLPQTSGSALAVRASPRPGTRPTNFARVVTNARTLIDRQTTNAQAAQTAALVVAPVPATPSGPISGGVAQAATMENAMRLRDMNLIGVFGSPNKRRALVRMGNGNIVRVEIGSALDGGQVTAIGDSALNYVKRGRTYALQLPSG